MPCTELISALGIPYGQQGADLADPNTACSMQETPVYALCPSLHCDFIFFFIRLKRIYFIIIVSNPMCTGQHKYGITS